VFARSGVPIRCSWRAAAFLPGRCVSGGAGGSGCARRLTVRVRLTRAHLLEPLERLTLCRHLALENLDFAREIE
jgi:hypothetical protein